MNHETRRLIVDVAKRREVAGLNVTATVDGRTNGYSFATPAGRDDFIRRVELNGGTVAAPLAIQHWEN